MESGNGLTWGRELEFRSIRRSQLIDKRVKVKGSCNRESHNQVWGCDEGVGGWVGIVTAGEVAVTRGTVSFCNVYLGMDLPTSCSLSSLQCL